MKTEGWHDALSPDNIDEVALIAKMRIILAFATLLTVIIDPEGLGKPTPYTAAVFFLYTLQSVVICLLTLKNNSVRQSKLIHWLDVFWFTLLLLLTGPLTGFFLLFFFAISSAAFRWGYDEGARVTLACAALYGLAGVRPADEAVLATVLLRTAFLLGIGYMVSHWAEVVLNHKRQVALLRDVSRLANPRFGTDHTIASILEHTRDFFDASACMMLTRDRDTRAWRLTAASVDAGPYSTGSSMLDDAAAAPFLQLSSNLIALFRSPVLRRLPWPGEFHIRTADCARWRRADPASGRRVADLLDGRCFICAPVPLRGEDGRIFVLSQKTAFDKGDAAFLAQVAAQAFPVIENIELLDRMASDAAGRERRKYARDLHDTTVQRYIGLSHALQGVLLKAGADNPITPDLRQVAAMTEQFVGELRDFAGAVSRTASCEKPALPAALRHHTETIKQFYNLDIALRGHETLGINDRLGAEVFQLVSEGVSNIRRHTRATKGAVTMLREQDWLHIRIENECPEGPPGAFVPRSISERAASLGGRAYVGSGNAGATAVHIDIPV